MSQWRGNWKIWPVSCPEITKSSYTACPNEEGTERIESGRCKKLRKALHSMSQWRGNWKIANYYQQMMRRQQLHSMSQWRGNWKSLLAPIGLVVAISYTACPNEEGTERSWLPLVCSTAQSVTQHVPMKRELKVHIVLQFAVSYIGVTQHVPMKRELKGLLVPITRIS